MNKILYGKVIDNNDPKKQSRIKVHIKGLNELLPSDAIAWTSPIVGSKFYGSNVLPLVGDIVYIDFIDSMNYRYTHIDVNDSELFDKLGDEYVTSFVMAYRNLKSLGMDGDMGIYFTPEKGLNIVNNLSRFEQRKDNTTIIQNDKHSLHITQDGISLGSENESSEPNVMGEQNYKSLNQLNDTIKDLVSTMSTHLGNLSTTAKGNPHTMGLFPLFEAFKAAITIENNTNHTQNKTQIDKTKSTIVTTN